MQALVIQNLIKEITVKINIKITKTVDDYLNL